MTVKRQATPDRFQRRLNQLTREAVAETQVEIADVFALLENLLPFVAYCHGRVPNAAHYVEVIESLIWRDSDATATAALCEDIAVPQDLQARPERIAQNPSGSLE